MIRAFYHSIMPNSLLRFLVSGAANTLASYALYLLLLRFISYLWAYSLAYAAGIALMTWVIRSFGAYPDGVAFATMLLNILAPLIDRYTQPPVFGHKKS